MPSRNSSQRIRFFLTARRVARKSSSAPAAGFCSAATRLPGVGAAAGDVVAVKVAQVQADELPAELRVAQQPGLAVGQPLEVEGQDAAVDVEGQQDLDAAVAPLLVDAVDVADESPGP